MKATKEDLIKKYRTHSKDSGSTQVQIAILTERINQLGNHLKANPKDSDSRRGLLILVGKRRRLLDYLLKNDPKIYQKLIKDLGLRK
jgi:small subunit ribosomal protein S15